MRRTSPQPRLTYLQGRLPSPHLSVLACQKNPRNHTCRRALWILRIHLTSSKPSMALLLHVAQKCRVCSAPPIPSSPGALAWTQQTLSHRTHVYKSSDALRVSGVHYSLFLSSYAPFACQIRGRRERSKRSIVKTIFAWLKIVASQFRAHLTFLSLANRGDSDPRYENH